MKRSKKIKSAIYAVPVVGPAIEKMRLRYYQPHKNPLNYIRNLPDLSQIVQIGSNDGRQGDPIFDILESKPGWRALFVEPVPYLFETLVENFGNSENFEFFNAAINNGEKMTFYYVDPKAKDKLEDLPFWYDQLGSFDRAHIVKHLGGVLEPFIIELEIEGCSFPDMLAKFSIGEIDLLQVDTEGYDWNIISQLRSVETRPTMILFEHSHLGSDEKDAAFDFLKEDYLMYRMGRNALAVKKTADRKLHPSSKRVITGL